MLPLAVTANALAAGAGIRPNSAYAFAGAVMKNTYVCVVLGAGLMAAAAQAQTMQWVDFPPEQSRLVFDAPGLSKLPAKAQEGIVTGGNSNVRRFAYIYPSAKPGTSFATVVVFTINAEATFFNAGPDFDTLVPALYAEFQNKQIAWDDAGRQQGVAPIGITGYRRFTALGRSCVAFGGLYGVSTGAGFENGGVTAGNEQILGYYCAPQAHRLSVNDAELVLSRLGYGELGKPEGPSPAPFAGSNAIPAVSSAPAASTTASPPPPGHVRRPAALIWEGREGLITATVTFDPKASTSRLDVVLPGETRPCFGVAYTGADRKGSWSVQCPSGAHASGSFRYLGPRQGSVGEGEDNKGAKVAFTVAGE